MCDHALQSYFLIIEEVPVEQSLKWILVNSYIRLPSCLAFPCETQGGFDVTSTVTWGLILYTTSILTTEHKQAKFFNECYLHEVWLDPLWYTSGFQYSWSYTGVERHTVSLFRQREVKRLAKKSEDHFLLQLLLVLLLKELHNSLYCTFSWKSSWFST